MEFDLWWLGSTLHLLSLWKLGIIQFKSGSNVPETEAKIQAHHIISVVAVSKNVQNL